MPNNELIYEGDNPFLRDESVLSEGLQAIQNDRRMVELQAQVAQQIQDSKQKLFDAIQKQTDELNQITIANEFTKQLNQNYINNPTNAELFEKQIKSVKEKLLGSISNVEQRAFFRAQFDRDIDGTVLNISKNYLKQTLNETFNQSKDAIDNAAVSASIAINNMFEADYEDLATVDENLKKLGEAYLNVETALSKKDNNGRPLFDESQQKELRNNWEAAALEAYCKRQMEALPLDKQIELVSNFNAGKSVFSIPLPDGKNLDVSGRDLSFKNFNALSKSLSLCLENNANIQKEQHDLSYMKDVVAGKINPDPKHKNYRRDSDVDYRSLVKPFINFETPENVQQSTGVVCDAVFKLHTIPPQMESDLRACLSSGNFNNFSFVSDVLKNISVNNPDLIEFFDKRDIAKALTMNKLTSAGVSPEEAFNQVTKSFSSINNDVRENRIRAFNKTLSDPREQSNFDASIMKEGWFFKTNKQPLELVSSEFYYQLTDLTREYYAMGADFETARESALSVIKTRWGNSEVNGDNYLTALPPEKFYAEASMDGKTMRNLLLKFVNEKIDQTLESDRIVVLADKETYLTAGNATSKPSYA